MADIIDKISGMAKEGAPITLSGLMSHPIWGKVYFFLKVAFSMAIVFFVAAFIYKFYLQYKIKLTIYKKIGTGGVEAVYDSAKIMTDAQNKTKLSLFKTRKGRKQACTLPIPEAKFKGKKGRFDHYSLWMDDNMELHPIEHPIATDNFEKLIIRPQERAAWGRMEDEMLFKKFQKKDLLMQYAAPAVMMIACITAFLIFFFASKEIGAGMANLASQFAQIASSCTKLGG
jgi:hypothetical protein